MSRSKRILTGIFIALIFAFVIRWIFGVKSLEGLYNIMTLSFLLLLPFGVGYLTVFFIELEKITSKRAAIGYSTIPILAFFLLTLLFSIEGIACWLMILPIFLALSALGGLAARYSKVKKSKNDKALVSLVVLLPLLLAPIERIINVIPGKYEAYTEIIIAAPKSSVWSNVTRVRAIEKRQDRAVFTRLLGFPRPIKAELDKEAVGGKRKAIFDKGLVFDEVVTRYEDKRAMTFTIHANPYDIPSTTMDEHIVVGGKFFDVLTGTYQLEQLDANHCKLKLFSTFQLNTTFNFYAGIWATWIMKDIQQNILKVIKDRAEQDPNNNH